MTTCKAPPPASIAAVISSCRGSARAARPPGFLTTRSFSPPSAGGQSISPAPQTAARSGKPHGPAKSLTGSIPIQPPLTPTWHSPQQYRRCRNTFARSSLFARAGDPRVFDLGNGAEIIVKDGRVEVRDRPDTSAASVTSERDGQRVTRTVTISAGGKVSVGGETAPDNPRGQVEIPGGQGVVLDFVAPDGPASRAGLAAHDILLTLDSKPVTGVDDFRDSLRKAMPAPEPKQEE